MKSTCLWQLNHGIDLTKAGQPGLHITWNKDSYLLPQLGGIKFPRRMDAAREGRLYNELVKRVFLADGQDDERSALRLLLVDLKMQVVGEAADWPTTLAQAPGTDPDMLLVDWGLVESGSGAALAELRKTCPVALVIVLISHLDARQQAALSAGADAFISKGETLNRLVEGLRAAVRLMPG